LAENLKRLNRSDPLRRVSFLGETMMRNNEIKVFLTDEEMRRVTARADRELIDAGMWMRRTAVSIADGRARVIANELVDNGKH
jgi:hypothetical protein